MRLANVSGRLNLVVGDRYVDLESVSVGALPSDPQSVFNQWDDVMGWLSTHDVADQGRPLTGSRLEAPVPRPAQVFAVALNYPSHAAESGFDSHPILEVFTKSPTCIAGPRSDVPLATECVDHEVELVFAISRMARNVSEADAWNYVAGFTVGQDISDRSLITPEIFAPGRLFHQLGMDKSFPGFGPIGPSLVTIDEFDNPSDLEIKCWVNGQLRQSERTSSLIFTVPALISELSKRTTLLPGDLCFTGTPDGVGVAENPKRFLKAGDVVRSAIEGIGVIENRMVAASP